MPGVVVCDNSDCVDSDYVAVCGDSEVGGSGAEDDSLNYGRLPDPVGLGTVVWVVVLMCLPLVRLSRLWI